MRLCRLMCGRSSTFRERLFRFLGLCPNGCRIQLSKTIGLLHLSILSCYSFTPSTELKITLSGGEGAVVCCQTGHVATAASDLRFRRGLAVRAAILFTARHRTIATRMCTLFLV